jgi:hypothetical protein
VLGIALAASTLNVARTWSGYHGLGITSGQIAVIADAMLHGERPGDALVLDGRAASSAEPTSPPRRLLTPVYFPAFPAGIAVLVRTGLSWKDALRTGSIAGAAALLIAVAAASRGLGGGWGTAACAGALLCAQFAFKGAVVAGRGDLIAAAFAVAALAAWLDDPGLERWWAPVLAAAALLAKATAIGLPLAVLLSCVTAGRWTAFARFSLRFAIAILAGVALTLPVGGPVWYAAAAHTILTAPMNVSHALRGPAELLRYLASYAEFTVAFSIAVAWLARPEHRRGPLAWFLLATTGVALLVMSNRGGDHNHLLEPMAAASLGAALWVTARGHGARAVAWALVGVAVVAASWRDVRPVLAAGRSTIESHERILNAVAAEPGPVLAEDPLLSLAAGRRPAVTDTGILRALIRRGDETALFVLDDLRARAYALVVLNADVEAEAEHWYRDFNLGSEAVEALRTNYRLEQTLDGFFLYRPAPRPGTQAGPES